MQLSFIIPVYNEVKNLEPLIAEINVLEMAGHEVIVVDGGSQDATLTTLQAVGKKVISSAQGRARQMNAGASLAVGEVLVFLHADTTLPVDAAALIVRAIQQRPWGRFNVVLSGEALIYRVIAAMMNLRSCLTGIATGDQCIFITRQLFETVGGYQAIPLMEDIYLSKSLKKFSRPFCIKSRVVTSSRRWQQHGVVQTILLMWFLRLAYYLGVSPQRLHNLYYKK